MFKEILLIVLLSAFATTFCGCSVSTDVSFHKSTYNETKESTNSSSPFGWNEVKVSILNQTAHAMLLKSILPMPGTVNSTFFVSQPVLISLTTMASRMDSIDDTITNLLQARLVPTVIYLFISREPFLMDTGVKQIPKDLLCLVAAGYLRIVYTQNIGPHRKLLPLLKRHWGEDVYIATMDDDLERDQSHIMLYQLLKYYVKGGGGDRMVSLRARRIGICKSKTHKSSGYDTWSVNFRYDQQEMLVLPTGNGGILYKPAFFNEAVFHNGIRKITTTADDVTFRLATLFMHIPVQLGCIPLRSKGQIVRECEYDDIDRKYDEQFGPRSTQYYYKATIEVTNKLVREYEVKLAAESLAGQVTEKAIEGGNEQLLLNASRSFKRAEKYHKSSSSLLETETEIAARRKLARFRIKRVPKSMNSSDLFSYNRNVGNNEAWQTTLKLLKSIRFFDFDKFAGKYIGEREEHCMDEGLTFRAEASCAVYDCTRFENAASSGSSGSSGSDALTVRRVVKSKVIDLGDAYTGGRVSKIRNEKTDHVHLIPQL